MKTFGIVLVIVSLIHVLDMWELGTNYASAILYETRCYARSEPDWTVFFLCAAGGITFAENFVLIIIAYSCQFLIGLIGILIFAQFLRHNLHYVKSIYLRCRRLGDPGRPLIVLDFDDVDRCFGLKSLSNTFNIQVRILSIAGAIILTSRYANIEPQKTERLYSIFVPGPNSASLIDKGDDYLDLFLSWNPINDTGQLILIAVWIICLLIVSVPIALKFLPLTCREAWSGGISLDSYLMQLIPPESAYAVRPDIRELAKKFARRSFWPSGDVRAYVVYFLAIVVLFLIWTPFPLLGRLDDGIKEEFSFLVFIALMSLAIVSAFFMVLKFSISYVSTQLVKWLPFGN